MSSRTFKRKAKAKRSVVSKQTVMTAEDRLVQIKNFLFNHKATQISIDEDGSEVVKTIDTKDEAKAFVQLLELTSRDIPNAKKEEELAFFYNKLRKIDYPLEISLSDSSINLDEKTAGLTGQKGALTVGRYKKIVKEDIQESDREKIDTILSRFN